MKKSLLAIAAMCAVQGAFAQGDTIIERMVYHPEVVVTGTRTATDVRYLPLTITQISNEKLAEGYNISMLPSIVEETPGLFATSRGMIGYGVSTNSAGGIKVRGVGDGAQMLVLIDGQPQFAGLMGHPIPDAYQSFMADKVEILRGPSSLLYGSNAMAGVINIVTRNADKTDGVHTDFMLSGGSYGTFEGNGMARVRKGKLSAVLGASYQRTDGHRYNSAFEQITDFIKVGYDINKNWTLNGDVNLTYFEFNNPGPEDAPLFDTKADIIRGLASISATNNYKNTSGCIRLFYDWGHHEINDGHLWGQPEKDYLYMHDDFIAGVTAYQNFSPFSGSRFTVGADFQTFGGEAWNDFFSGDKKYLVEDHNQTDIAGYIDYNQQITSWFSADLGVRIDNHSQAGTEIIPQAGVSFYTPSDDNIKLLVSKGFRNPIIREMYMFPPQNENLEPERMINYELSYTKKIRKFNFGANIYYIKGDNLITTVPRTDGAGKINMNTGEFENKGFELSAAYTYGAWRFNLNYSFLDMDTPVTGAPENKIYFAVQYTNGKFSAKISEQSISGLYISTGNNAETEDYNLINANVSYKLLPWLKLFVKGENLLNKEYQTYAGFTMPKATFMGGICINL